MTKEERGGLTEQEHEIMMHLVEAWNKYAELKNDARPQNEGIDFMNGIHLCQSVLQQGVLRRDYPDFWR